MSALRSSAAAFLLAAVLAVTGSVPARAAQSIKITIPTFTPADGAYFAALQKGYFAAEGLDVEFVFTGGGVATPAIISGSVDGSASGSAALSAILKGAALRIVLVFTASPAYQVWAQPEIHTLADLKGKPVGVNTRGDTFEIAMRLALQAAGLSPDSVGYTPVGFGNNVSAAFDSGALSAVILSPGSVIEMHEQGALRNAHMISNFYGKVHMPWNSFVVSEKTLYGNPDLTKKMLRAIIKGARYIRAFKSRTVAFSKAYEKDTFSQRGSDFDYDEFMEEMTRDWTVDDALIQSDLNVRASLLNVPKEQIPPIAKVYDFGLVRAINAELDRSRWKPTP
jgi:ABC-type nitrate/sulfonate/bicarbonate transport system substrate-binding protein